MSDKIGILYFSLSPNEEALRKNWTDRSKINLKIANRLYHHTLDVIKDTNIPYRISSEISQVANGFSDKITNAISHFFKADFDHVIVIGNDCPDIDRSDIIKAYKNVLKGSHSLGLTKDGGSYLFTLSKKQWDRKSFEALPWCTDELGFALKDYLSKQSNTIRLKTKSDIDTLQNLQDFVQNAISNLASLLKQLISISTNYAYQLKAFYSCTFQLQSKRGPPLIHM